MPHAGACDETLQSVKSACRDMRGCPRSRRRCRIQAPKQNLFMTGWFRSWPVL